MFYEKLVAQLRGIYAAIAENRPRFVGHVSCLTVLSDWTPCSFGPGDYSVHHVADAPLCVGPQA